MNIFKKLFQKAEVLNERVGQKVSFMDTDKKEDKDSVDFLKKGLKNSIDNAIVLSNCYLKDIKRQKDIDLITIYNDKVFIIKVVDITGCVFEENREMYEEMESGNVRRIRNPFSELHFQVGLLKKKFPKVRFNEIVYFYEPSAVEIDRTGWFLDIDDIASYIKNERRTRKTKKKYLDGFMDTIKSFDSIKGGLLKKSKYLGTISPESLDFVSDNGPISKSDIDRIEITHEIMEDHLKIFLKSGRVENVDSNTRKIIFDDGRIREEYLLSQIDEIEIGR